MKNMKKLLAALMAVMVFVMAAPAVFAEEAGVEQPAQEQAVREEKTEEPKAEEPKAEAPKAEESAEPEATAEAVVEVEAEATAEPEATPEASTQPEATPEASAEPEATPEVTAQPEATPEVTAEPEATPEAVAQRDIKVVASESSLKVGEMLKLTAKLTGFDGIEYKLTWQVKVPGEDWKDLSGEHGETLKVELDDDSIGCAWRVVVETAD
jgi:hypothetical protein